MNSNPILNLSSWHTREFMGGTYLVYGTEVKRMTRDDIVDHLGADNWEQVEREFWGLSYAEIACDIDGMFPHDDNKELIDAVWHELQK